MPINPAVFAAQQRFAMQKAAQAQLAQQSRGGQVQGRGVQIGPVGAVRAGQQQQRAVQSAQNAQWEQAKAQFHSQQQAQKGPEGFGGFVGNILDNPVVKTALAPMKLMQYPKNAIIAGLQEVRERVPTPALALSGLAAPLLLMDKNKAEADPRSFWEKVNDPSYGFGSTTRQIDVGNGAINNWANRGVGLWGDIALDPLTYASAGMNKIPGATGRVALATEAEKLGLSEPVIRAAGKAGARGVREVGDEAAIAALKHMLPEPGLRFGGELGIRIPGTRRIGEGVDLALQKVRSPATESAFGRGVRRLGSARHPGTREAVESLVARETMTPSVAAGHIRSEWLSQAEQRMLTGALENTARDIAKHGKDDAALTHALETGDLSTPLAQGWGNMNSQVRQRQVEAGVSVGDFKPPIENPNGRWVEHLPTKDGAKAFDHPTSNVGGKAQGLAPESQQFSRQLRPRQLENGDYLSYTIQGRKFTPITGTIKEANDWSTRELGIKLFEDSPAKLSAYAVESAADAVGKVAKLQALVKTGSQKVFGTTDKRVSYIDEALTRAASKETGGDLADVLAPTLRDITGGEARLAATGQAVDEAGQMARAAERGIGKAQRGAYGEAYGAANEAEAAYRTAARAAGPDVSAQLEPILAKLGPAREAEQAAQRTVDQLTQLANTGLEGPRRLIPEAQAQADQLGAEVDQWMQVYRNISEAPNAAAAAPAAAATEAAAAEMPADVAAQVKRLSSQARRAERTGASIEDIGAIQAQIDELSAPYQLAGEGVPAAAGEQLAPEVVGEQAVARANAAQRSLNKLYSRGRYAEPVVGEALPEAAPFQTALERASGARQGLEAQAAPLQARQAAREALGAPPNVDEMVAKQVQPRLEELAMTRAAFVQHRTATEMSDIMAESALGLSERELQARIAQLPEHAQAMIQVTMKADRSEAAMGKLLGDIRQGKLDDQIIRQANEGYELMRTDRLMGRDVIIDSEMKKIMDQSDEAMRRFNEVARVDTGLLGKVVDEYTKFFKAWATATPGFHVRNAMSATFMNMSEGVSFREMLDGNLIWKTWRRYGGGSELARRASRQLAPDVGWVKYLPERLREVAPDVVKAVYASGAGGRYTASELGERAFGETAESGSRIGTLLRKTHENIVTEASHNVGEHIEGRVRAGLALHALGPDNSGSWTEAVQRIKRVHFDYSDVNEVDRGLKRIIPFWTFMSRNLPLQVQQMWVAPRAYSQYQSLMNNVNADPEGNLLMPDWLQRSGARFITQGGLALAPDIGPNQIETSLGQIADPKSLLSNLNPIYKTPLQLATNQNFFYGNQYKANDYQQPGWESAIPSALLAMVGVGKRTKEGGVVQERKILDAIRDLIPLSAQANRLGSTTADREGKEWASRLAYLGVPVRQVDQAKERKNRQYDLRSAGYEQQALRDALAKFGGAA